MCHSQSSCLTVCHSNSPFSVSPSLLLPPPSVSCLSKFPPYCPPPAPWQVLPPSPSPPPAISQQSTKFHPSHQVCPPSTKFTTVHQFTTLPHLPGWPVVLVHLLQNSTGKLVILICLSITKITFVSLSPDTGMMACWFP